MPDCEIMKPNLDGYAPTTYPSRTHHVAVHVAAIATFAEIATFYVMQRGSINTVSPPYFFPSVPEAFPASLWTEHF